jgi:hypothetical protein
MKSLCFHLRCRQGGKGVCRRTLTDKRDFGGSDVLMGSRLFWRILISFLSRLLEARFIGGWERGPGGNGR